MEAPWSSVVHLSNFSVVEDLIGPRLAVVFQRQIDNDSRARVGGPYRASSRRSIVQCSPLQRQMWGFDFLAQSHIVSANKGGCFMASLYAAFTWMLSGSTYCFKMKVNASSCLTF